MPKLQKVVGNATKQYLFTPKLVITARIVMYDGDTKTPKQPQQVLTITTTTQVILPKSTITRERANGNRLVP